MSVLATETSLVGTSVIVYRYATGFYYSTPTPQQVTINFTAGACPATLTSDAIVIEATPDFSVPFVYDLALGGA